MRIVLLLFAAMGAQLIAQPSVSQVALSESKDSIQAFTPEGTTTLGAARFNLNIAYPAGKKERGDLTVVYDPKGGYYFWLYAPLYQPTDTQSHLSSLKSGGIAVYVTPTGLIEFNLAAWLSITEYNRRAGSLDAAESAAMDEIRQGLALFEKSYPSTASAGTPHAVKVFQAIRRDLAYFTCPPENLSSNCRTPTTIASVTRQGENWQVVLRNQWDQEVILDSKFNLVSTRKLTQSLEQ